MTSLAAVSDAKLEPETLKSASRIPGVFIHPERERPRFAPFKAMSHMQKLIADKEDTEQVFHVIRALNGNSLEEDMALFLQDENGRARLREKTYLPDLLDNHEPIRALPEGSVGRAYVDFMEREGLTAAGLVEENERFSDQFPRYNDDLAWYGNRLRDTHDLYHVLSGYGRDALGEATLLAFSHAMGGKKGPGLIFIAYMGARQIAKVAPKEARIMDVLWEGRRHGGLAKRIAAENIEELLKEPLDAARERLNIQKPTLYKRALRICDEAGIAPQPPQAEAA